MRTNELHTNIVKLSVIRRERAIASSPFGPVRAGLTTLHTTSEDHQLTELLNSLEREVATLQYKSCTDLGTLLGDIQALLVNLSASIKDTDTTE